MNTMKIVCFGDSITDGETYALLLKQALKEAGRPVPTMIAAGIGGDKADGMLKRIDRDVLAYKPDMVIVNCGVNDVMQGKPIGQYAKECGEIFDRIRASGAVPIAMLPSVVDKDKHGGKAAILDDFAEAMRKAATERDIPICDLHSAMQRDMRQDEPRLICDDGIHFELEGYRSMVRELLDTLGYANVAVPKMLEVSELNGLVKEWKLWAIDDDYPADGAAQPEPPAEGGVAFMLPHGNQPASWWLDQERRRGVCTETSRIAGRQGKWYLAEADVKSETDRNAWIILGGEPRQLWLNGESIWSYDPQDLRGWHPGCLRLPVKLHAGDNLIRLAVGNAFALCVTDTREEFDQN